MNRSKIIPVLGGVFAVFVVGLLLWLHLAGDVTVPRHANPLPIGRPVVVCDDAPPWVHESLTAAEAFWQKHGASYGGLVSSDCHKTCLVGERMIPCNPGAITIALRDQAFSEGHEGETLATSEKGEITWATILLPSRIEGSDPTAPIEGTSFPKALPKDINTLVIAHELGHAEGYTHTKTGLPFGFSAIKTGELMNPTVMNLGWGDAGLPKVNITVPATP